MLKKVNKKILLNILIFISLILIFAFIIEYKLGHQPCNLCLYERIPYFISIGLIIKMLFYKKYQKITLLVLVLIFIASTLLAFYHFGIEEGIFIEPTTCSAGDISKNLSKEELLDQLKQKNIGCKDVSFRILGLSLAAINTVISFIFTLVFLKLFLNYKRN